jgi:hypothetical protein
VGNYILYEYKGVNEITGQASNFVHPGSIIKSGTRCWQRPKKAFPTSRPLIDNFYIKNNTSSSEIFEKKIIFHLKVDEITGFDGM